VETGQRVQGEARRDAEKINGTTKLTKTRRQKIRGYED
jgi:hypothetical protein